MAEGGGGDGGGGGGGGGGGHHAAHSRSRGRRGSLGSSGRKLSWESKAAMEAMLDADAALADSMYDGQDDE